MMNLPVPLMSLGFFHDPLSFIEDFTNDPRFFIWDILGGVLFVALGVMLFIFGDRLLLSLMQRVFHLSTQKNLARVIALVLGVILILLGIVIGLNGLYTMFVIY